MGAAAVGGSGGVTRSAQPTTRIVATTDASPASQRVQAI